MKRMLIPLLIFSSAIFAQAAGNSEEIQGLIHQGDNWWRWSNERQAESCYTKALNEASSKELIEMASLRRGLLYAELGEDELAIKDFERCFDSSEFSIFTDLINDPTLHASAQTSVTEGLRQALPGMKPAIFDSAVAYRTKSMYHPSNGEVGGAWDFLYDGDSLASFHEMPERISKCIKEIEQECLQFLEKARDSLLRGEVNNAANQIQAAIRQKFLSTEPIVHRRNVVKKPVARPQPKPQPTKPRVAPLPIPPQNPAPKPTAKPATQPTSEEKLESSGGVQVLKETTPRGRRRGRRGRRARATQTAQPASQAPAPRRGRRGRRARQNTQVAKADQSASQAPAPRRGRRGRRARQNAQVAKTDQPASQAPAPRRGRRGRRARQNAQVAKTDQPASQTPAPRRGRRGRRARQNTQVAKADQPASQTPAPRRGRRGRRARQNAQVAKANSQVAPKKTPAQRRAGRNARRNAKPKLTAKQQGQLAAKARHSKKT